MISTIYFQLKWRRSEHVEHVSRTYGTSPDRFDTVTNKEVTCINGTDSDSLVADISENDSPVLVQYIHVTANCTMYAREILCYENQRVTPDLLDSLDREIWYQFML